MKHWTVVSAPLVLLFGGIWEVKAASFQGLGDLPGGIFYSQACGVSADGSVVVGFSGDPYTGREAFRWTPGGGMVGLGDLPDGEFHSEALGVSDDGSVVVGKGNSASGSEALRWTPGGGMVSLGDVPGGAFSSSAYGVSADGSVVVGVCNSASGPEAFRWTDAGGMVALGDLPDGDFLSAARGVSDDGSVVVGQGNSASGSEAFRWTEAGGMVGLGDLPGGPFYSCAYAVSADGSVVVGWGRNASNDKEAFRWTEAGGMVGLGDLPGGTFLSQANGVSADGSVVVGMSDSASGSEAFIWDATGGMQSLNDSLAGDYGLDLGGWRLVMANDVSPNGRVIVGYGVNPAGDMEAWLVLLDPLELHWVSGSGGDWDTAASWDYVLPATHMTDVYIEPDTGLTVVGPAATTTIKSLTLGAQTGGTTTLKLQDTGTLNVNELTGITWLGKLSGSGTLNTAGGMDNYGEVDLGSGALQLVGGTLTNHGLIRGDGRIHNTLSNTATGEVRVGAGERMVLTGGGSTNAGKIEVIGGEIEFTQGLDNEASTGLITGRDATFRFGTGLTNAGSVGISVGTSDVFGNVANEGTIVVSGGSTTTFYDDVHNEGEIRISVNSSAVFFGELSGEGPITGPGTAYVEGDLRPGNSTAEISFGGNLAFGSAAGLEIEFDGPEHDQLTVAGNVYLDGTLILQGIDDLGAVGESIQAIIQTAEPNSIIGDFAVKPALREHLDYGVFFRGADKADNAYNLTVFQAGPGDFDGDGDVDLDDLSVLDDGWGPTADDKIWTDGDGDGDGDVDLDDLSLLDDHWAPGGYPTNGGGLLAPGATAVPEPGTLAMLAAGVGLLLLWWRRRPAA